MTAKISDTNPVNTPLTPNSNALTKASGDVNNDTWVYFQVEAKSTYWTVLLSAANTRVRNAQDRGNDLVTFRKGLEVDYLAQAGGSYSIQVSGRILDDGTNYRLTGKILGTFGAAAPVSVLSGSRLEMPSGPGEPAAAVTDLTPCSQAIVRVVGDAPGQVSFSLRSAGTICFTTALSESAPTIALDQDLAVAPQTVFKRGLTAEWRPHGKGFYTLLISGEIVSDGTEYCLDKKVLGFFPR